ncbi:hypothetical protein M5689_000898 [Euphorbia peplus]|nr:hypothetical protein M5689_000898 [Euphorbia peplus]
MEVVHIVYGRIVNPLVLHLVQLFKRLITKSMTILLACLVLIVYGITKFRWSCRVYFGAVLFVGRESLGSDISFALFESSISLLLPVLAELEVVTLSVICRDLRTSDIGDKVDRASRWEDGTVIGLGVSFV